ncbi:MAG: hypothetical protein JRN44_00725 [Nitrososphaerota archaeon]|nr:hypothetical protein [Nitrososphaerota archaeon]MDG6941797.1 hypothetical protein [Nitrososphaerota archaeon]MDG6947030.1 hypothetical protein [Nitrososphaerota archaeon]MDG6950558.1 hypothetical protein [Nitrososphaerota archaeon]
MKSTWGVGALVAALLAVAAGLLKLVALRGTVSLALLLIGLWTFVTAFAFVGREDRAFYAGWGVVIAGLSLTYLIPLTEALGLILIAVAILIVVTVYFGRAPKDLSAAASPPPSQGGTPAAGLTWLTRSRP